MSFNDREFDVYVILGDPAKEPAWREATWDRIARALDPLMKAARDRAGVRSTQLRIGSGSPNQRAISFGRIAWSPEGHKKWIHPSIEQRINENLFFMTAEVWAPSWTVCEKNNRAPECYFGIRNEQSRPGQDVSFNPTCLLAVATDQRAEIVELGRKAAQSIADTLGALVRAHWRRPWGYNVGADMFTNAIGDLIGAGGLFRPGPRTPLSISVSMLKGEWAAF